ncbi:uncharacterized protein LOC122544464 isoform X2 [Chiloscyllium plagiosum]|nr:uncharacterized protein LOC122544464 isoform X2 [Chiloscyllium plagiosum]
MTCLLIIQALPSITMKRKQQREKVDHKRVHFVPSQSRYTTSSLNKSVWFSAFSHSQARACDHLFTRSQTLIKGQLTTLSVLLLPRLSLPSLFPIQMTAATEYLFPQTETQPKDKSLSSLNTQGDSAQCSFIVPSGSCSILPRNGSLASVSLDVQPSIPLPNVNLSLDCQVDQRLKSPCVSAERRVSRESNTNYNGYPEKCSVPHCLISPHTPQSVMEPRLNPGFSSVSDSNSLGACLVNYTIEENKTLSSPPHLTQALGMWAPVVRESQPFHQTSNFWSCLQDKPPKPNSSLKGLTGQNGEVRLTTPQPEVTTAWLVGQPKSSIGEYSVWLRITTRISEQNRWHPKTVENDNSCLISHLTGLLRPEFNTNKNHSVNQTSSLTSVPRHCQNARVLSAPSLSASNLEWKSEPPFGTPNHMRSTKCDDFVEIPLDEIFPPNPKTIPEKKAWSGFSEPMLELWTKILPSIFDCFHVPVMDKLRAPVKKNLTTASSHTLNVKVESETPGTGTGLDTGHVWGKILKVSRSSHEPLPWGKAVADLLIKKCLNQLRFLKMTSPLLSEEQSGMASYQL